MKRIGSNLRPAEPKPERNFRNIITYTDEEEPRNEYPKKIISPALPKSCCTENNRETVGTTRVVEGFKLCYKICQTCGHAVRYFHPAVETNDEAVRQYRAWKRYMVQ